MTEVIVGRPLLRVLQDLVGLAHLLKADFGARIAGIAVRVVFLGEPPVCGFDLRLTRHPREPKCFIVAPLGHVQRVPFSFFHLLILTNWR